MNSWLAELEWLRASAIASGASELQRGAFYAAILRHSDDLLRLARRAEYLEAALRQIAEGAYIVTLGAAADSAIGAGMAMSAAGHAADACKREVGEIARAALADEPAP